MEQIKVSTIFVQPKRPGRWAYVINDGRRHGTDYEGITDIIFPNIRMESRKIALEYLQTLQCFLVFTDEEDEIVKLVNNYDIAYQRERIEAQLNFPQMERFRRKENPDSSVKREELSKDKGSKKLIKMMKDFVGI